MGEPELSQDVLLILHEVLGADDNIVDSGQQVVHFLFDGHLRLRLYGVLGETRMKGS